MSYHDNKLGHTQIRAGDIDNLSIGWDYETDPGIKQERTAQLLLIPWTKAFDHHHVDLSREEATALRDWLNDFLDDTK